MKISCTDYELSTDTFSFVAVPKPDSTEKVSSMPIRMTGTEIVELAARRLSSCSPVEIAAYVIWDRCFDEDPADMLNQSVEL